MIGFNSHYEEPSSTRNGQSRVKKLSEKRCHAAFSSETDCWCGVCGRKSYPQTPHQKIVEELCPSKPMRSAMHGTIKVTAYNATGSQERGLRLSIRHRRLRLHTQQIRMHQQRQLFLVFWRPMRNHIQQGCQLWQETMVALRLHT